MPTAATYWTIIQTSISAVAVCLMALFYYLRRRRKEFRCQILFRQPLWTIRDEFAGRTQVLFDGQPVPDVQLMTLKISNSGNQPIASTDYERPVRLSVGDQSTILSAEVVEPHPDQLTPQITILNNALLVQPLLMNPKDSFVIKVLASHLAPDVRCDARIVGVKDVRFGAPSPYHSIFWNLLGGFLLFVLAAFFFTNISSTNTSLFPGLIDPGLVAVFNYIAGFVAALVVLIVLYSLIKAMAKTE